MAWPTVTSESAFARLWEQADWVDSENVLGRLLFKKLDSISMPESRFMDSMTKMPTVDHVKPRWGEEVRIPNVLVGTMSGSGTVFTVTGNIFNKAVSRARVMQCVDEGGIMTMTTGGVTYHVKVTAVDPTLPVLTVEAHSDSATAPDGAAQSWKILGEPYSDATDIDNAREIERWTRYTTTQIFSEVVRMLKTRGKQRIEFIGNELEHQVEAVLEKMKMNQYSSMLNMSPVLVSGAAASMLETEKPALSGVLWRIRSLFASGKECEDLERYVDMGGAAVTKPHLDALILRMYLTGSKFEKGRWEIWTDVNTRQYMHDYDMTMRETSREDDTVGSNVNKIKSKLGKVFTLHDDVDMPEGTVVIANMEDWGWGYFADDQLTREEKPSGGRYKQWQLSSQLYGAVQRNAPVSSGMLYNAAAVG